MRAASHCVQSHNRRPGERPVDDHDQMIVEAAMFVVEACSVTRGLSSIRSSFLTLKLENDEEDMDRERLPAQTKG